MSTLPFDLAAAMSHLSAKDEKLAELISATVQFALDESAASSPYEALLEAIAYQSISGKAAATIYGRVEALSGTDRPPHPNKCSSSASLPYAKPASQAPKSPP